MNGTEFTFYNIWTDPLSLMFYGFCAVFLMTHVKPLLEFLLQDIKKEIQKKVETKES